MFTKHTHYFKTLPQKKNKKRKMRILKMLCLGVFSCMITYELSRLFLFMRVFPWVCKEGEVAVRKKEYNSRE